jgi:hypothetical protein
MCKEMVIDFKKVKPHFDTITVNCKKLEPVSSVKVLGVIISNSLRGSDLTSTTTLLQSFAFLLCMWSVILVVRTFRISSYSFYCRCWWSSGLNFFKQPFSTFYSTYLLICVNKGEYCSRPIRAFVYVLALSQSERVHFYYFRFRRVFQHENYSRK